MTAFTHHGETEGEPSSEATVAKSATVQREGEREATREVEYSGDAAAVRVHRQGFTLEDEWLKRGGGDNYFDESQLDRAAVVARHATTAVGELKYPRGRMEQKR